MKKQILFLLVAVVAGFSAVNAQPQRRTVEERVAITHAKLDSAFKLDKAKIAEADSAFAVYYRAMDKVRDELMSGGGQPDRQAMMEKMTPLVEDRDKKLQTILTAEQFKTWKEQIEPSMRGRRGGGGGGGN